jgi:tetratricopeptide (TPR) repeat protein
MAYRDAPPSEEGPRGPILKSVVPRVLGALVIVSAIAVGAWYFLSRPKPVTYDYGQYGELVRTLEANFKRDPCDSSTVYKLFQLYLGHRNFRGVVDGAERFTAKCGNDVGVRKMSIEGYRGLNDYPGALADVDKLIALQPDATYHFFVRGKIHQQFGKNAEAVADYQRAFASMPNDVNIVSAIAAIAPPCEGAKAIRKYLKKNEDRELEMKAEMLESKCSPSQPGASATGY